MWKHFSKKKKIIYRFILYHRSMRYGIEIPRIHIQEKTNHWPGWTRNTILLFLKISESQALEAHFRGFHCTQYYAAQGHFHTSVYFCSAYSRPPPLPSPPLPHSSHPLPSPRKLCFRIIHTFMTLYGPIKSRNHTESRPCLSLWT